jgi:hypothetical protein
VTAGFDLAHLRTQDAAYAAYARTRDEVLRLVGARDAGDAAAPSRYWAEELGNIDYMLDATPLIVRKLRHHAFHITGIRPYDYREFADRQAWFERRLHALVGLAGGTDLLVPEAASLGGFGYTIGGGLYNVDTLKFFEVLVGMRRAGVLDPFQTGSARRLVLEIGAGWGGFAYQFKTLFPRTTYVVVDFAELFLYSATYLSTLFPGATMTFWRERGTFDEWQDADVVFVPHDRMHALRELRDAGGVPDLLVNLVSFQEMTSGQIEAYAELAASIGCRSLYSLNRDRSRYNEQLDSVSARLSTHYDLREIRLLGSPYTKAIKKDSAISVEEASRSGRFEEERYRHLAGTLRGREASRVAPAGAGERAEGAPRPRVGIGVTLYNRAAFLEEALDSLLTQTYPNVRFVLVDDGSTDGTEAIARAYAARDSRIRYVRHEERRGMVAAWRSAFEEATAGGAEYFAWGSDHDRWHPEWLAKLVAELQRDPRAVLAYPLTERMDPEGMPLSKPSKRFDTGGVDDLRARWAAFSRSDAVSAGDMIYGLMRSHTVRAAGVFREVLCPDRLLVAELTLRGSIRQVPEVLWFRRQFTAGSVARQRRTLFPPGARPPSVLTPPWFTHARSLWGTYGRGGGALGLSRIDVARLVAGYTFWYAWRHYGKTPEHRGVVAALGRPRWMLKQVKHYTLLTLHWVLVGARSAGVTPAIERMFERITGRPRPWRGPLSQ